MPIVPRYDSFQAAPSSLPQARVTSPDMPDIAGQQAQQFGQGAMQSGNPWLPRLIEAEKLADYLAQHPFDACFVCALIPGQTQPFAEAIAAAKAKQYQKEQAMSRDAIYDQLTSEYGEQFTPEEAQYAVEHLGD